MKSFLVIIVTLIFSVACSPVQWSDPPATKPKTRTAIVYYPSSKSAIIRPGDDIPERPLMGIDLVAVAVDGKNYKLKSGTKIQIPIAKTGALVSSVLQEDTANFVRSNLEIPSGSSDIYIRVIVVPTDQISTVHTAFAGSFTGPKFTLQFRIVSEEFAIAEQR